MASQLFLDSRNKAFKRLKMDIESVQAGGKQIYVLNDEDKARKQSLRNIVAAQSSLVSIIPINAATTSYVFNWKEGINNAGNSQALPMECRLKDQDVFYISSLGFLLTCFNYNGYLPIRSQMYTYPIPSIGAPLPGIADVAALMGIWNQGFMEVKVNGNVVTPKWWMQQHLYVPQTESNMGGIPVNPFWDQQDFPENGFVITEPNWVLNGGNNNLYTVNYGQYWGDVFGGGNQGTTVQLGLIMVASGWLAQNASSIMFNQPAS